MPDSSGPVALAAHGNPFDMALNELGAIELRIQRVVLGPGAGRGAGLGDRAGLRRTQPFGELQVGASQQRRWDLAAMIATA